MGWLPQKGCCCCCELKTCAIVLGVFDIICGILTALSPLAMTYVGLDDHPGMTQHDKNGMPAGLVAVAILVAVIGLAQLIFGSILVHGARKENPRLVKVYLVASVIFIILSIIARAITAGSASGNTSSLITDLIYRCLSIYFWLHVYSFYKNLKNPSSSYSATQHA